MFAADATTKVRSEVNFRHSHSTLENRMHDDALDDPFLSDEAQDSSPLHEPRSVATSRVASTAGMTPSSATRHRKSSSRATMSHSTHPSIMPVNYATSPSEETEIWLRSITRMNFDLRRDLESLREELGQTRKDLQATQQKMEEKDVDVVELRRKWQNSDKSLASVQADVTATAELTHTLKNDFDRVRDSTRMHVTDTKTLVRSMTKDMVGLREAVDGLRATVQGAMTRLETMEVRVNEVVEESTRLLYQAQGTIRMLRDGNGMVSGSMSVAELDPDFALLNEDVDAYGMYGGVSGMKNKKQTMRGIAGAELADAFPGALPMTTRSNPGSSRRSSESGTAPSNLAMSPLDLRKPSLGLKHLIVEREREKAKQTTASLTSGVEPTTSIDERVLDEATLAMEELIARNLSPEPVQVSTSSPLSPHFGRGDRVRVIHRYNM